MDYVKKIDTPAATYTELDPLVTVLELTAGKLTGGWIYFPSGPAGKLHVSVWRGSHQLAPANPEADYALDDTRVPLHLNYLLDTPPYQVEIKTWNESTTYEHTCTVCIFLEPIPIAQKKKQIATALKKYFRS